MNIKTLLISLCGVLLASGCATPQQQARWAAERNANNAARYQQFMQAVKNRCSQYGYQEGTDAFARCVQVETNAAEQRARANAERSDREFQDSIQNAVCASGPIGCNRTQRTNCSRDMLGNVRCVSY